MSQATNKYQGKSMQELGKLFFELGNEHLVPELRRHIDIALKKVAALQAQDEDLSEIIIVADVDERQFAFAVGDGSDLEGPESDCVFYIAKSAKFNDCMELIQYIESQQEGHLHLSQEACHWVGDAVHKLDSPVAIFYNHYYGEAEDDPFCEN
jgi:hypothetical protein